MPDCAGLLYSLALRITHKYAFSFSMFVPLQHLHNSIIELGAKIRCYKAQFSQTPFLSITLMLCWCNMHQKVIIMSYRDVVFSLLFICLYLSHISSDLCILHYSVGSSQLLGKKKARERQDGVRKYSFPFFIFAIMLWLLHS